jgi:hypothetical protein
VSYEGYWLLVDFGEVALYTIINVYLVKAVSPQLLTARERKEN